MDRKKIQVNDLTFELSIHRDTIQKRVSEIAKVINESLSEKNPIFLGILNGSFMFASDLFKQINIPI